MAGHHPDPSQGQEETLVVPDAAVGQARGRMKTVDFPGAVSSRESAGKALAGRRVSGRLWHSSHCRSFRRGQWKGNCQKWERVSYFVACDSGGTQRCSEFTPRVLAVVCVGAPRLAASEHALGSLSCRALLFMRTGGSSVCLCADRDRPAERTAYHSVKETLLE